MNSSGLLILLLVTLSSILIGISSKIISKRETDGQLLENQMGYLPTAEKRPFCNAFTGCGKKRSSNFDNLENRELMDPLMRLSRRIIQEAKLWEISQNRFNNNNELPQSDRALDYLSTRRRRSIDSQESASK